MDRIGRSNMSLKTSNLNYIPYAAEKSQSGLLARNTLLNLIGQISPLIIGVFTIPLIVKGLGVDRFGILSLAWVSLGYFAVFDLGMGRATTNFVSETLGKGENNKVATVVLTAAITQSLIGILGGLVLIVITPILIEKVLNVPPLLVKEVEKTFYVLGLSIPIVVVSRSFRGALEAAQRFGLVNMVRIWTNTTLFILPLVGIFFGWNLPAVVGLLVISQLIALFAYLLLCLKVFRISTFKVVPQSSMLISLLKFGGWVAVSDIAAPILVYADRFLIGALLTISAVGYYTVPYEIATKLLIIPSSLIATLFPFFSALKVTEHYQLINKAFIKATEYISFIMIPITGLLFVLSTDILHLWLGGRFSYHGAIALRLLAIGIFVNSVAHIPYAFLQGNGRVDLTGKFHVVELPIYVFSAWIFIVWLGISGAALAWVLRVVLDALFLFAYAFRISGFSAKEFIQKELTTLLGSFIVFTSTAYIVYSFASSTAARIFLLFALSFFYLWLVWKYFFEAQDRSLFLKTLIPKRGNNDGCQ